MTLGSDEGRTMHFPAVQSWIQRLIELLSSKVVHPHTRGAYSPLLEGRADSRQWELQYFNVFDQSTLGWCWIMNCVAFRKSMKDGMLVTFHPYYVHMYRMCVMHLCPINYD